MRTLCYFEKHQRANRYIGTSSLQNLFQKRLEAIYIGCQIKYKINEYQLRTAKPTSLVEET